MSKTVYLAHSMLHKTEESQEFKEKTRERLLDLGYTVIDPSGFNLSDEDAAKVVWRCLRSIDESDYVVALVMAPSYGMSMEIFYAHTKRIPVYTMYGPAISRSPWVNHHSHQLFFNHDELCGFMRGLLCAKQG